MAETATTTAPPTAQTGTIPNPIASNTQDFSGSDDEIVDNFGDVGEGLPGEKGNQSEPASSTLESDIVNGIKNQSGEKLPSDNPAGAPEPVQEPAGETGTETSPEPVSEPEPPEFPPDLLKMAGYTDAAAAQAAGFENTASLFASIKRQSDLLVPGTQPAQPSKQGLYRRPAQQPTQQPAPSQPPEPVVETEDELKSFQISDEMRGRIDEDLLGTLDQMNEHNQRVNARQQQELKSLRSSSEQRESDLASQQSHDEEAQFDQAVQDLGEDWHDTFGEGSGDNLNRNGQTDPAAMTSYHHRVMLFEAAEAVREVNAKQGFKPMGIGQEIRFALMQRYPDKFQQSLSGESNGSSGPRKGVTASRPTQRNTPPKSQNDKLVAAVNKTLLKKGSPPLTVGTDEEFAGDI